MAIRAPEPQSNGHPDPKGNAALALILSLCAAFAFFCLNPIGALVTWEFTFIIIPVVVTVAVYYKSKPSKQTG